jgi:heme exporter protein D
MADNLRRMSGVLGHLDASPRSVAKRGMIALVEAAIIEGLIVAIAREADWPAGAFYVVSALALTIFVAIAVPIIEPPRTSKAEPSTVADETAKFWKAVAEDQEAYHAARREASEAETAIADAALAIGMSLRLMDLPHDWERDFSLTPIFAYLRPAPHASPAEVRSYALALLFWEGTMSDSEIADLLGTTVESVQRRRAAALRRLQRELARATADRPF